MRADAALAARYAALKAELAAKHPRDREAYTDAKAAFVQAASKG
ncbi:MAG: GrpB family protein [Polaromonas sp.]|nr:GrpB family protein [Polaromonas sp.]